MKKLNASKLPKLIILFCLSIAIYAAYTINRITDNQAIFIFVACSFTIFVASSITKKSHPNNPDIPTYVINKIDSERQEVLIGLNQFDSFNIHFEQTLVNNSGKLSEETVNDKKEITLSDAFKNSGYRLMLLGKSGSGKTTLVYKYAEMLAKEYHANFDEPYPLILNLQTWSSAQFRTLEDWIIFEINQQFESAPQGFQIISKIPDWVDTGKFLLILDGLDEVDRNEKDECLISINRYLRNTETTSIRCIVTCEETEYDKLFNNKSPLLKRLEPFKLVAVKTDQIVEQLNSLIEKDARWESVIRKIKSKDGGQLVEAFSTPLILSLASEIDSNPKIILSLQSSSAIEQYICRSKVDTLIKRKDTPEYSQKWLSHMVELLDHSDLDIFRYKDLAANRIHKPVMKKIKRTLSFVLFISGLTTSGIYLFFSDNLRNALIIGSAMGVWAPLMTSLLLSRHTNWATPAKPILFNISLNDFLKKLVISAAIATGISFIFSLLFDMQSSTKYALTLGLTLIFWLWNLIFQITTPKNIFDPDFDYKISKHNSIFKAIFWLVIGFCLAGCFEASTNFLLTNVFNQNSNFSLLRFLTIGIATGITLGIIFSIVNGGGYVLMQMLSRRRLKKLQIMPANNKMFFDWITDQKLMFKISGGYKFRHKLLKQVVLDSPIDITDVIDIKKVLENSPSTKIRYVK